MPFAWEGVTLHASGASALRVRLAQDVSHDRVAIEAADLAGNPVISVAALHDRAMADVPAASSPQSSAVDSMFVVDWQALTLHRDQGPSGSIAVLGDDFADLDAVHVADLDALVTLDPAADLVLVSAGMGESDGGPTDTQTTTVRMLDVVQAWVADDARLGASRLVVVTRHAAGPDVTELGASAVWGLVRAAQSEHPDRFALVDPWRSARTSPSRWACWGTSRRSWCAAGLGTQPGWRGSPPLVAGWCRR